MPRLLITNDDGIDSPALSPLVEALHPGNEVHVVVPVSERSWIGKGITRFGPIHVRTVERGGIAWSTVDGTPADCVALGVHEILPAPPDLTVSGVNLGLNYGTGFVWSSGTVGAAVEAWIAGCPAIAFSMAIPADAFGLTGAARARLLGAGAERAAATSASIVRTLLEQPFPDGVDLFSVNLPAGVTPRTPRRVTRVTRARYGPIFSPHPDGGFVHRFRWYHAMEDAPEGDMETVNGGVVSISPLRMEFGAPLPDALRRALETGEGEH
jgi:5'-nucleotidase